MMLDIEILKTNYAVSYGSVTLKSLQNDNVPELDLLVREAIQNSSDASLSVKKESSYTVNFTTGSFNPSKFNSQLDKVNRILDKRYSNYRADFLEIRDSKTDGLTGPIKKSDLVHDDHGNFFKLIFDTGKRQTNELAGGNWGFGKSVYYRVGVGIVIFYSRIKKNNGFEDRLIITLIEDEGNKNPKDKNAAILNSIEPRSAGKAWWGERDGEDLLPITNANKIKLILDIFGIQLFKSNETGTSIIIPYLDSDRLLKEIIPYGTEIEDSVNDYFSEVFTSSIANYLRLSIQKWYAPKIHNRYLEKFNNNKWLRVFVNNTPITKASMFPFFRLVQELYNTALAKTYGEDYQSSEFHEIKTFEIKIRSYFQSEMTAGYVSLIKISRSELSGNEMSLSPYDYIGKFESDGGPNEPIVMFARDPGMVIDYSVAGPWVKNIAPLENQNEYLMAFFVPKTKNQIKKDFEIKQYRSMRLGEYLRECEASDHMAWNDPVKMQIVKRIQTNTVKQIRDHTEDKTVVNIDAEPSKLSNKLGKRLLPQVGYGKVKPNLRDGSGEGGGRTKTTNYEFSLISQTFEGNDVKIGFKLKLMHDKKNATISIMIASEAGLIDAKSWEDEIGTDFPVQVVECYIMDDILLDGDWQQIEEVKCNVFCPKAESDKMSMEMISEINKPIVTQIKFCSYTQNPEVEGVIKLNSYDKKYRFTFRVE